MINNGFQLVPIISKVYFYKKLREKLINNSRNSVSIDKESDVRKHLSVALNHFLEKFEVPNNYLESFAISLKSIGNLNSKKYISKLVQDIIPTLSVNCSIEFGISLFIDTIFLKSEERENGYDSDMISQNRSSFNDYLLENDKVSFVERYINIKYLNENNNFCELTLINDSENWLQFTYALLLKPNDKLLFSSAIKFLLILHNKTALCSPDNFLYIDIIANSVKFMIENTDFHYSNVKDFVYKICVDKVFHLIFDQIVFLYFCTSLSENKFGDQQKFSTFLEQIVPIRDYLHDSLNFAANVIRKSDDFKLSKWIPE